MVRVGDTELSVERRGNGRPVLLIHGGGEDATLLAGQAESLAAAGFDVVCYDRRGTGRSGRDHWPSAQAARQHADDAAALIGALDLDRPTVLGLSSGAVVALQLAARHPGRVGRVIAWEPPAAGVIPGGAGMTAEIMKPVTAHLRTRPGDFVGAQAILLTALAGRPVAVDDPAFATARANAEAMVRDDPTITLAPFARTDLAGRNVVIAVGSAPNPLIADAVGRLAAMTGTAPTRVAGDHEVYLTDPDVLTRVVLS